MDATSGIAFRDLGDGRGVWVYQMIYTFKLVLGPIGQPVYDNHWCYRNSRTAMLAFAAWNPLEEPEPQGWVRHPPSGRRRFPYGDPATEIVRE